MSHLFSIGHGNKSIEELIRELDAYHIQYLIDVRSKPYSKYYPHFNQDRLRMAINATNRIEYAYFGDLIGGIPVDDSCYTDGHVDYMKLALTDKFKQGIRRLVKANELNLNTCVMCSESDPSQCHRSKLIGVELQKLGIDLQHIYLTKTNHIILKSQNEVLAEAKNEMLNLFNMDADHLMSRKQYGN